MLRIRNYVERHRFGVCNYVKRHRVVLTFGLIVLLVFVFVIFLISRTRPQAFINPLRNSAQEDSLFEINRRALMDSYNTQTISHGTYILAIAAVLFAIVPQAKEFNKHRWAFLFIIALIFSAGIYAGLRILFWSYLGSDVLAINEAQLIGENDDALILRLSSTTLARFNQNSSLAKANLAYFAGNSATIEEKGLFVFLMTLVTFFVLLLLSFYFEHTGSNSPKGSKTGSKLLPSGEAEAMRMNAPKS